MQNRRIAAELVMIARELTGAVKDLADVKDVLTDLWEKKDELDIAYEKFQREHNRAMAEASKDIETKTKELLFAIRDAIVGYFSMNGMGIRKVDDSGGLIEVFIGSDDGVNRVQSKVSVHLAVSSKSRPYETYMLRNEDIREDKKGVLAPKGTISKLIQEVKKADKRGYWSIGR